MWLFKNTPREALGDEAVALHDLYVTELLANKKLGPVTKKDKRLPPENLVEAIDRHSPAEIAYFIPSRTLKDGAINEIVSQKTCFTLALACASDKCDQKVIQAFLLRGKILSEAIDWVRSGGLHLACTMIDAKPEFLHLLIPSIASLGYTYITFFDGVCMASIREGMSSVKPDAQWNEADINGFSFHHLAVCRGGYLDLPADRRDAVTQEAIDLLVRVKGFDSHYVNHQSANLRDRMRLMIFNAGFMLMLRKVQKPEIDAALRPVFDTLMGPFGLSADDAGFLWRRSQLCLYAPFPEYFAQLQPAEGELFGRDQERAQALFAGIGVHTDQMDKDIVLKKGLGILYDPKFLSTSNNHMPGWSNPMDAFGHGQTDLSSPAQALLRALSFDSINPGLEALCGTRINAYQLAVYLQHQQGHHPWLEDLLVQSPGELPEAFRIEVIFPVLDLARFCEHARHNLVMLYANFIFKSFFKTESPYHGDRLKQAMTKFREHTDPARQAIPEFGLTMIRAMAEAKVISDEIMRDLGFSGFELSQANVGTANLNTDDLLAKDLGL